MLDLALKLSKQITVKHHKEVYYLQEFQLKHKLRDLLNYHEGEGLPLAFFAGLQNWKEATESEAFTEINSITIQDQLASQSIICIYTFLEFEEFEDPLDNYKIPQTQYELNEWRQKGNISDLKWPAMLYIKNKEKIKRSIET